MEKTKTLAIILATALIITVAINFYQYTLNLELSKKNIQIELKNKLDQVKSQINDELQTLDQIPD